MIFLDFICILLGGSFFMGNPLCMYPVWIVYQLKCTNRGPVLSSCSICFSKHLDHFSLVRAPWPNISQSLQVMSRLIAEVMCFKPSKPLAMLLLSAGCPRSSNQSSYPGEPCSLSKQIIEYLYLKPVFTNFIWYPA